MIPPEWGKPQGDIFATLLYDDSQLIEDASAFVDWLNEQTDWPIEIAFRRTIFEQDHEWRINSYIFRSEHEAQFYHFCRGAESARVLSRDGNGFLLEVQNSILGVNKSFRYKKIRDYFEEWDD